MYSHSEGSGTSAIGAFSHAEGDITTASNTYSHAEGSYTHANGTASHSEGSFTTAQGDYSHAEGYFTKAAGDYSHAEGDSSMSIGDYSHAEGYDSTASGRHSHASGYRAVTAGDGFGEYTTNPHNRAYAWQGQDNGSMGYYHSHGDGTFNINPAPASNETDVASGFYIGETTLKQRLDEKASASDIVGATNAVYEAAKVYSDDKTFVISTEDEYYRTGASGELGTGWAYYAISGDGHRRFAAYAPKVSGAIMLIPLNDDDPICETFGTNFSMSASSRTVTSILDYTETGFRGYNSVTFRFAPIADIPLTVVVSKNATTGTASINSVNLPYSFYDTVHEQYYYDVSVDGTDVTYSYELYDTAQGAWTTGYGSFRVAIDETGGDDIEMTVFGDKGAYMLAAEVDTARSQLVQRTGKRGELGTGPGYKIYDFTSDVRSWELTVPRLDANRGYSTLRCGEAFAPVAPGPYGHGRLSIGDTRITTFNSADYPGIAGDGYYIFPSVYADPLSLIQTDQVVERVVRTEGTLSSKCKSAIREIAYFPIDLNRKEWGPGVFNLSSSNECGTAYGWGSLSLDTNRLEVIRNSFNNVIAYGLPGFTLCFTNIAPPLASTTWGNSASNPYYDIYTHSGNTSPITNVYTLSNFKLLSVDVYGNFTPTVNNQTISFNITYDVVCHGGAWYMTSSPSSSQSGRTYYISDTLARFDNQVYTYTVPRTLSLVAYASTWETLTTQGERLITDKNQHLFWDEAMKVTWEITVTNGCFFSEIIGDKDYRKEDY